MPVYDFYNDSTGKTISVLVPITAPENERHEQIGDDGLIYKRVYSAPNAARDTSVKEGSKDDFRRITEGKNVTHGNLFELSGEMSKRRAEKSGKDPVKEKFYRDFERQNGVKHTAELREEKIARAKKVGERLGIRIEE